MSELNRLIDEIVGEDEWSRHQALERLRQEGASQEDVGRLLDALRGDNASRRSGARMALAALASPESPAREAAQETLREALSSSDPDLRLLAASALGEAGTIAAGPALVDALDDPDDNVAAAAADALGELGYAPALDPLVRLATTSDFWVRAAVIVALGRLRDERAVPTLTELARTPGLEPPLVEAVRSISHPEGLGTLEVIASTAPMEAMVAAGAILCAHPDVEPPEWVVRQARHEVDALRVRFLEEDDPALARLLGLSADDEAIETLVSLVGPPRRSEAALTGLLAVPPEERSAAVLDHLDDAVPEELPSLLALLPSQQEPEQVARLVPYLSHGDAAVRSAAAEALARAPAEQALPVLNAELGDHGFRPEVVRAMGGLGEMTCGALLPLLDDPEPAVRRAAADALSRCGVASVAGPLREALERESDLDVRRSILQAVGRAAGEDAVELLAWEARSEDPETRLVAVEALGSTGAAAAAEPLIEALHGPVNERLAALRGLERLAVPETAEPVEQHLDADDPEERRAAARALVPLARSLDPELARRVAGDEDEWVRLFSARISSEMGEAGRLLLERLAAEDPAPMVRAEARRLLRRSG